MYTDKNYVTSRGVSVTWWNTSMCYIRHVYHLRCYIYVCFQKIL